MLRHHKVRQVNSAKLFRMLKRNEQLIEVQRFEGRVLVQVMRSWLRSQRTGGYK
jgi:hypothetical protein